MKDNVVKVGIKDRHLIIPDGWHLVKDGPAKEGDMFANLMTFKWDRIDKQDLEENSQASEFDFLIRQS